MKKTYLCLFFIIGALCSCERGTSLTFAVADFDYFEYKGKDSIFTRLPSDTYANPILTGSYPNPSICRKGDDYYLVSASCGYFPGIPLFKSHDLVHWKQIGHVLDRPEQLCLEGVPVANGLGAPTIRYNASNETFYVTSNVDIGVGAFLVKTRNPENGWSDPILLPQLINGWDPSLFFDEDGKAYLLYAGPPLIGPQWRGHSSVWLVEYNLLEDKVEGTPVCLLETEYMQMQKYFCPKMFKKDGRYILLVTSQNSKNDPSEYAYESASLGAPFEAYSSNPVLSQVEMPIERSNWVMHTAYADMVQTQKGDWYSAFAGVRPYKDSISNTGSETFLLPVKWDGNFPVILKNGLPVPLKIQKRDIDEGPQLYSGNLTFRDDFRGSHLEDRWVMQGSPNDQWWSLHKGHLRLQARDRTLSVDENAAFFGIRQMHSYAEVFTQVRFNPINTDQMAGLAYYLNNRNSFVLAISIMDGKPAIVVQMVRNGYPFPGGTISILPEDVGKPVVLKMVIDDDLIQAYASFGNGVFFEVGKKRDCSFLAPDVENDQMGPMVGVYASSMHRKENLSLSFAGRINVGVSIDSTALTGMRSVIVREHFHFIEPRQAMSPKVLLANGWEGPYNWLPAEKYMSFALRHGMKVYGQRLVDGQQMPSAFFVNASGADISKEELYKRTEAYMRQVMSHLQGRISIWEVTANALNDNPWKRIAGDEYLEKVFRMARSIAPDAKLLYADNHLTDIVKRRRVIDLLRTLIQRGTPIDGIRIEANWQMDEINQELLEQVLDDFAQLGIELYISNLELRTGASTLTADLSHVQCEQYRMISQIFESNKDIIKGVSFSGLADGDKEGSPYLFDANLNPKQALDAVKPFTRLIMPSQISDGMVVQREKPIVFWGVTAALGKIYCSFNGIQDTVVADYKGKWEVEFPPLPAGGPYTFAVNGTVIKDIFVGDVWILAGGMHVKQKVPLSREPVKSDRIRFYIEPESFNFFSPRVRSNGKWEQCILQQMDSVPLLAYEMAINYYQKEHVPVGIITLAASNTSLESWMAPRKDYQKETDPFKITKEAEKRIANEKMLEEQWLALLDRTEREAQSRPAAKPGQGAWEPVSLPISWSQAPGSRWFKSSFTLSHEQVDSLRHVSPDSTLILIMGKMTDRDQTYLNGNLVGQTDLPNTTRMYAIPRELLKEGENQIQVRIISQTKYGSFAPINAVSFLIATKELPFKAEHWSWRIAAQMEEEMPTRTLLAALPSGAYNAMLAPSFKMPISGFVWCHGHSIPLPDYYFNRMTTLIREWRMERGDSHLPFILIQAADCGEDTLSVPSESRLALFREMQRRIVTEMDNVFLVVTHDIGKGYDYYPLWKDILGMRVADAMYYANVSADKGLLSPNLLRARKKKNSVILLFDNVGNSLQTSDGKKPGHFAIAGKDGVYYWAEAEITGKNMVTVSSEIVPDAYAIRYGWGNHPTSANLVNSNNLPASTFMVTL